MTDRDTRSDLVSRRPYLKMIGTGLAAGLAGCTGDGGDGNGSDGDSDGSDGGSDGSDGGSDGSDGGSDGNDGSDGGSDGNDGGTPTESSGTDISGQSFSFWSVDWSQSEAAEAYVDDTVSDFESNTGASIELRKAENPAGNQQVWVQAFENNDYPHVFEAGANVGTMVDLGVVKPVSEYIDFFSDEFREQFEPWMESAAAQMKGFDGDMQETILPLFGDARSPMVTRRSFYEETPGLSPEDFPPSSYDGFLEQARTLQEDGPVDYGTLIFGGAGDILDNNLPVWAFQEGGIPDGMLFSPDWEDVQLDNDTWKAAFKNYVEIYTEEELSPPFTPSSEDEQIGALLREGRVGLGWHELFTFPQIKEQVPEIVDDLMYGVMWGSEDNPEAVARGNIAGFCFTYAPDGEDPDEWENAQRAAAQYIEQTYGSVDYQVRASQDYGRLPLREDSWDETEQLAEDDDNVVIPTMFDILDELQGTEFFSQNHPRNIAVTYTDVPPNLQEALTGDVSPEEACENAAEAARERL
jgi:ABC-type glycerol-3-phosphate transport system substrate-binding protein